MHLQLIASLDPYGEHRAHVIAHPLVHALRLNTIKPITESPRHVLKRLSRECGEKPLWIDVKGRQLRVTQYTDTFYGSVEVSHRLHVETPVDVFFKNTVARIVEVQNGNRLILSRIPRRTLGKGEAINILDPSLEIEGYLTAQDIAYLRAAAKLNIFNVLASFFERYQDLIDIHRYHPKAQVIAKIESARGMEFVRKFDPEVIIPSDFHFMAAQDDLYINMGADKPQILNAVQDIIREDPKAIVASRILTSLEYFNEVTMADLMMIAHLISLGYRRFMLSDGLCYDPILFAKAMAVWQQIVTLYQGETP
ncbi:hypothetical protein A2239_00975 [Candidatus Uhrbacteria bacterium RIFOXYA2_FULL_40_9]|nr:MAG: hypothetical protein A2239_00975 [Candidatus Uhrbacteria bacterium RIFOXYA2_FULL_40_9]OGL97763.1 MAG: hypothetical protein A2332_02325 [Candidatus Uhrbacteria bacterium RIFOXYB2_FULL_41_18]